MVRLPCNIISDEHQLIKTASKSSSTTKRSGPLAPGVAFVTGGARGLGNAIAVSFAREGARGVVIVDINAETLNEGKKRVEAHGAPVSPALSRSKWSLLLNM
jgi:shikimate 5-dehydrogenase